ncbi:MAG: hypothetical protein GX552_19290 [Chloroflexi bacterium]|jgi:hypothetical protein|nr:hypothetical protein [Chloroflexota bacterium]
MKKLDTPLIWGILLIAVGLLVLLQNLGVLGGNLPLLWAVIFAAVGVRFLYVFVKNRAIWWPLIPAFALFGLAGLLLMDALLPAEADAWGGAFFLGALALSFWAVYLVSRENWWAVIPGGVLLTLAFVAAIGDSLWGIDSGAIFFLGLSLTFFLVAILPTPEGRMRWAWIPAVVLFVLALVVLGESASWFVYVWPIAIIALGAYFLFRALSSRNPAE